MAKNVNFQSVCHFQSRPQGQLSLSFFRGQSNEYQEHLGTKKVKSKLTPCSGSVALKQ